MGTYVKLYIGTSILANRLAFLLDEAGIATIIKNHDESARLAGFGTFQNSSELLVKDDNLQEAYKITENFKKEILK
ncbi:putative signal transducing protein [uncultured Aquimarina sp.]|uniref:putative signal transducing protein n=1 Tax=uncultured Aquimarina sp. TaxID=575652 RepID=UPI002629C394|nr:DUF2007 domain-containing protein [uncultured Aquimarina sp.]